MNLVNQLFNDAPFIAFLAILAAFGLGLFWFFKDAFAQLRVIAKEHVQDYSQVYVKGGCLILISVGTTFKEVFQPITQAQAETFMWWDWVIKFSAPIIAGLAVLNALLDRSMADAQDYKAQKKEDEKNANPPTT